MKNILIINGHQKYPVVAEGKLTQIYIDSANEFFAQNGFAVENSVIENQYSTEEEVAKFAKADFILFQYPVYWMGVPWITKKYIDEIFSAGQGTVTYLNDGRTRSDASKKYGSGGLMSGTKYMLSLTYNCPASEFNNKNGFFDGLSIDEANIAVHKTFQFCGAKPLATFSVHDIFKGDLDIENEKQRFTKHLAKEFLEN
ncbi:MAG: hypothetical protein RL154_1047 [Pseudomonadota bacterium]|jgi:modulator of drug activity B